MATINIAVPIAAQGQYCGFCQLIDASGPDDAPVHCTAFGEDFDPAQAENGRRIRLPACVAATQATRRSIDSEDQWQAWRIGRDCRQADTELGSAIARLETVFEQPDMRLYFDAGYAGRECPTLTAPTPQ